MMIDTDLRALDVRAIRATVAAVERLDAAALGRPTPCADWTLADLLVHMTVQQRGFAAAAEGLGADESVWATRPLAADPVADYRDAAEAVIAAFAPDDVPERIFELPEFGPGAAFPGHQAVGFHLVDNVVHGWDVAAALGLPFRPDPDVADATLRITRQVPDGENRGTPGAAFAPGIPVPEGADALVEILTRLGRSPEWRR